MEESIQVFWRRALMPRQLYSEAVLSTGGRYIPCPLRGKGLGESGGAPFAKGFCPLQGEPKGS